ncbi:MAG TPA: hypothetical protein VGA51_20075 [Casimicrobiaceae bacterium]
MNRPHLVSRFALAAAFGFIAAACASGQDRAPATIERPLAGSIVKSIVLDASVEERILALDPEHISDRDVRSTLAAGPTPRIILLHGGVYPVHLLMESFSRFLTGMGYPEERIRDAGDGSLSRSPYESSDRQAGLIAWYYEREGVRPILVGHSQGGIQVVKILHELAGSFGDRLRVFNPLSGEFEERTTIVDPLTGRERPIIGVSVACAAAVGTGGWALALPIHWMVLSRVRSIPDTVDEFTGYRIGIDFFAWDGPGLEGVKTFHAAGKANVRNVTLPAEYSHVFVPGTAQLAEDPAVRDWINAFDPNNAAASPPLPEHGVSNIMWAADVWHSIKRHWTLEAQRFIRARRAATN